MRHFPIILLVAILVACSPTPEQIATPLASTLDAIPSVTPYPTHTPYPTLTAWPSLTPYPTYTAAPTQTARVVIVTPTYTATPLATPTETIPPTETSLPTPTPDPLYTDKSAGFYLVGIDIGAGVWRSQGTSEKCYWEITTKTGDIINNHYGMAGGTMYIPAGAYQVQLKENCGTWVYLGE